MSDVPNSSEHPSVDGKKALGRLALFVLGLAVLITGVVAVFATTKDVAAGVLVTAGLAVMCVAFFSDRLTSLELAGVKLQLQAVAARRLLKAEELDREGRSSEAEELRRSAERLLQSAAPLSQSIEDARAARPPGQGRTAQLESLVAQARAMAPVAGSANTVEELFDTGTDGNRVTALALMQQRPELATPSSIQSAISSPRSAFEQYHALIAAEKVLSDKPMDHGQAAASLIGAVRDEQMSGKWWGPNSDRARVATHILSTYDKG